MEYPYACDLACEAGGVRPRPCSTPRCVALSACGCGLPGTCGPAARPEKEHFSCEVKKERDLSHELFLARRDVSALSPEAYGDAYAERSRLLHGPPPRAPDREGYAPGHQRFMEVGGLKSPSRYGYEHTPTSAERRRAPLGCAREREAAGDETPEIPLPGPGFGVYRARHYTPDVLAGVQFAVRDAVLRQATVPSSFYEDRGLEREECVAGAHGASGDTYAPDRCGECTAGRRPFHSRPRAAFRKSLSCAASPPPVPREGSRAPCPGLHCRSPFYGMEKYRERGEQSSRDRPPPRGCETESGEVRAGRRHQLALLARGY